MFIYKITSKIDGRVYIGQMGGNKIAGRWSHHKSFLSRQKHYNKRLQEAWNCYGRDNFEFKLIEDIPLYCAKTLDELEKKWIAFYDSTNMAKGYNKAPGGIGNKGVKHTEEQNKKKSEMQKGKGNPFHGKAHSEKARQQISEFFSKQVLCIETNVTYRSLTDAAKVLGLYASNISSVALGKRKKTGDLTFKYLN